MFSICPQKVFTNKRLTSTDLRVYLSIQGFANQEGYCYPSIAKIATTLGVCRRTIERSLSRLEKEQVIARSKRIKNDGGYTSNGYYLKLEPKGENINETAALNDTTNMTQGIRQDCRIPSDTNDATNYNQCNNNNFNFNNTRACAREELGNEYVQAEITEEDRQAVQVAKCYSQNYRFIKLPDGKIAIRPAAGFVLSETPAAQAIVDCLTYKFGYDVILVDFNQHFLGEIEIRS
ncbi:MAG: helix-turn-helix domain-containing protein [Alphaproteobacteria bacterium]|nr:helix-turn-helix domain-containing protein [Alphaproteobacteria bacterium]